MITVYVMAKYYEYFDSLVKIYHVQHLVPLPSDCARFIISDLMLIDGCFEVLTIRKILGTFSFLFSHLIARYIGELVLHHGCFHYNFLCLYGITLLTHKLVA